MCSSLLGVNVGRSRLQFILFFFYKLRLPGFELETSGSDTMLDYDVPTSSPKSLS
jgi:hypothetical protein